MTGFIARHVFAKIIEEDRDRLQNKIKKLEAENKRLREEIVRLLQKDEPKDCLMCDGSYPSNDGMRRVCVLLPDAEFVDSYLDGRAPFCPLVEVAQS